MEKRIQCRDLGFDCDGVIIAKTENEALEMASEHARTVHGLQEITPEVMEKIRAVIKEV